MHQSKNILKLKVAETVKGWFFTGGSGVITTLTIFAGSPAWPAQKIRSVKLNKSTTYRIGSN